jgi:hypothetical protein
MFHWLGLVYLICMEEKMGLTKGIPFHENEVGQLVNDHFDDDSFLIILEDQTFWVNIMDYLNIFYISSIFQNTML